MHCAPLRSWSFTIQVLKLFQCVFSFSLWQKQLFLNHATVRFVLCYRSSGQEGRRLLNLRRMANIIFFKKNIYLLIWLHWIVLVAHQILDLNCLYLLLLLFSCQVMSRCEELTHWKRPWCWERLRARGEGGDRGWDSWMASSTQWTWVSASSGR